VHSLAASWFCITLRSPCTPPLSPPVRQQPRSLPVSPLGGRLSFYTVHSWSCIVPAPMRRVKSRISLAIRLHCELIYRLPATWSFAMTFRAPRSMEAIALLTGPRFATSVFNQADADRAADGDDMVSSHLNSHPFQHLQLHCIQGKFTAFFKQHPSLALRTVELTLLH
jgi:hypothetical protein